MFALGLVSLVLGFVMVPLGIVAWWIGRRDLRAMSAGDMEPSGRKMTQIGAILGIAGTAAAAATGGTALVIRSSAH